MNEIVENIGGKNNSRNCYCNSSKCFINRGIGVKEQDNHNKILHKYKCCKPCKNKFDNSDFSKDIPIEIILDNKIIEINDLDNRELENIENIDMKNKKNTKGGKQNTSDSKKKMGQEISKKNQISNEPWNLSTKVNKNERKDEKNEKEIEKKKIIKRSKIQIKNKGNDKNQYKNKEKEKGKEQKEDKKEKEDNVEKPKDNKEKDEKSNKMDKNKVNRCDSNISDTTYQDEYDDKETIYISYSLKGYIKIKTKKDIEICDQYYLEANEMCKDCECSYIEEINNNEIKEIICECCDCCDTVRTDYYSSTYRNESSCCNERCLCLG